VRVRVRGASWNQFYLCQLQSTLTGHSCSHSAPAAALPWPCCFTAALLCLPIPPQALMLRGEADLTQSGGRLMCLSLGLLFLHRQGAVDATLEVRLDCGCACRGVHGWRQVVHLRAAVNATKPPDSRTMYCCTARCTTCTARGQGTRREVCRTLPPVSMYFCCTAPLYCRLYRRWPRHWTRRCRASCRSCLTCAPTRAQGMCSRQAGGESHGWEWGWPVGWSAAMCWGVYAAPACAPACCPPNPCSVFVLLANCTRGLVLPACLPA